MTSKCKYGHETCGYYNRRCPECLSDLKKSEKFSPEDDLTIEKRIEDLEESVIALNKEVWSEEL